jgi:hypothetical protein
MFKQRGISDQQWFPTHYRLTEQDINQIVNDWEAEWKIPEIETTQKDTQPRKETQELEKDQEEEEYEQGEQGNGEGDT